MLERSHLSLLCKDQLLTPKSEQCKLRDKGIFTILGTSWREGKLVIFLFISINLFVQWSGDKRLKVHLNLRLI